MQEKLENKVFEKIFAHTQRKQYMAYYLDKQTANLDKKIDKVFSKVVNWQIHRFNPAYNLC